MLGLILKNALGRNSPTIIITTVAIVICNKMLIKGLKAPSNANVRDSVMSKPKTTMLRNLPTSMVEINC